MKGRKEEFFQIPKEEPFQVTRPGEAYIKGVGVRRIQDVDQRPLYCRVIVPARVPKNTGLNLFTAADDSDLMVTNIPRGNRLSVGAEAVIYRIRLGVAPEADLTVGDIMGVLGAGVIELGLSSDKVTVKSPLMMLPFTLFPGEDPQEFMEICDSDRRMGLKGMLADPHRADVDDHAEDDTLRPDQACDPDPRRLCGRGLRPVPGSNLFRSAG